MLSLPLLRPVEMPQLFLSSSVDVQEGILDFLVRYQYIISSLKPSFRWSFILFYLVIIRYIDSVNHYNRNALPVIRGTLKEAPGRELVFLEHLQLVEEDIMEIHHVVFRVSCARVLLQVFQTSKLIFSLRLFELIEKYFMFHNKTLYLLDSPTNAILTRMTKLLVPDVHPDIR